MTNELSKEKAIDVLYTVRAYYASLTAGYPKGKDCRGIGDVMCSEIANSCLMAIKALEQQPCEDYVSREATLKAFAEKCGGECGCCEYNGSGYDTAENCKLIKSMPTVTPQPKKGKWIKVGEWSRGFGMGEVYGWFYECSECGEQVKNGYGGCSYNYCPYCGSDNREEADE